MTDVDNNVSTATTYDIFGRPTLIRAAEGKPEETRTATEYSDTARRVITRSDLNSIGDGKLVTIQHYDQLGRVRLARQLEDSTTQSAYDETQGIKVQTRYLFDPQNHFSYQLASNPYRANSSYNAGGEGTMGWTRSKSDNGGKLIEVQTFGGGSLPAPWGGNTTGTGAVTTFYDANATTVTDQAGKQRKSVADALGRLIQVYEAPNDPNYNYLTSYGYDALDDLTTVNQGSQTRTFVYNSLKRLSSANNPESGTVTYSYDENGNLRFRTDARGEVTDFRYDALNRLTTKLYRINNQPDPNTPDVEYLYDNAANGKGRPWLTFTWGAQPFQTAVGGYDALGRVTQLYRLFGNGQGGWYPAYSINANYDRAGHITSMTYPSGRNVTQAFDGAGRLSSLTGNLGDNVQRTYAAGVQYSPFGGLTREQFGTDNALYHNVHYNMRGQIFDIRLSSDISEFGGEKGTLVYYYGNCYIWGGSGPDNNGNISLQDYYLPGVAIHDHYTYDPLNRVSEISEEDTVWRFKQKYDYDRHGNRTINQAESWGPINTTAFEIDSAGNNQLLAPGDFGLPLTSRRMQYDQSGNLKFDSYTGQGTRIYDAENRMVVAQASSPASYRYDADGQRVKRIVGATETWQIYGLSGELLAEYAPAASPSTPQKEYGYRNGELLVTAEPNAQVNWLVGDHLGTPRMIADRTGSLSGIKRHDYLPFGEEIGAGVGVRTTGLGYTNLDGVRQKFTQKERDNETGFDYFLARYYSPMQGRFTSPDEFVGGPDELFEFEESGSDNPTFYADTADPQSLNKYSYSYNSPLRYVDADGHQGTEFIKRIVRGAVDTQIGVDKSGANILIGAANIGGGPTGQAPIEPLQPSNRVQEVTMRIADKVFVLGSLLSGRGPANVVVAETKEATVVAAETANVRSTSAEIQEGITAVSPRAASREAMRREGIPTSQQPSSQISPRGGAGRQRQYEVAKPGGGTETKIVTNQLRDRNHGPHFEAGRPKRPSRTDPGGRLRHSNQKSKVYY